MAATPFFDAIKQMREQEELLLYNYVLSIGAEDEEATRQYLEAAYQLEKSSYPFTAPPFDAEAACWAARYVYIGAQLMLYRKHEPEQLPELLPSYTGKQTAGAILSADLCLRFVPAMINELRLHDAQDLLIPMLEKQLATWHYSGIATRDHTPELDFSEISNNPCLHQLYADRVVQYKHLPRAQHPALATTIAANLGNHAAHFWNEFNVPSTHDDNG